MKTPIEMCERTTTLRFVNHLLRQTSEPIQLLRSQSCGRLWQERGLQGVANLQQLPRRIGLCREEWKEPPSVSPEVESLPRPASALPHRDRTGELQRAQRLAQTRPPNPELRRKFGLCRQLVSHIRTLRSDQLCQRHEEFILILHENPEVV